MALDAAGLTSGGPNIDNAVSTRAGMLRSTVPAERRNMRQHDDERFAGEQQQPGDVARRAEIRRQPDRHHRKQRDDDGLATRARRDRACADHVRGSETLDGSEACSALERDRSGERPRASYFVPLRLSFLEEVAAARRVEQLARDDRLALLIAAHVDHLLDADRADGTRASGACAAW